MSDQDAINENKEPQTDSSQFSVFVHKADSYVGRHVVSALNSANYVVYGDTVDRKPFSPTYNYPIPNFSYISSINDAYALCNTFIFDIREDINVALQAFSRFEVATTKITIVLISTLMTWANTKSSSPLTGDDFRKRKPHPNFKDQYELELKATKLCRENNHLDVYILSCGIPYGDGEELLFPLFKYGWNKKFYETFGVYDSLKGIPLIGEGNNIVPLIHVKDLAQILVSTLQGQMIDRFVMTVDKSSTKLKDLIESISQTLHDGNIQKIEPDQSLILPWMSEKLIDYLSVDINAINELLTRVHMTHLQGFVSNIKEIINQFIDTRKIHPQRILLCGPPLSGKSSLAKKISYRYSLPLINVDSLLLEAKKNEKGYWNQFIQQIQGEISPSLLLDLLKWKLLDIPCKNQGYILDGIPSNSDFSEALWADVDNYPNIFIELESNDIFLRNRAKQDPSVLLGINNIDEFESRLSQYRITNPFDESHLFFSIENPQIKALTLPIDKCNDIMENIAKFLGKPQNFGKPPSFILKDSEELEKQKRLKIEKQNKAEQQLKEIEETKKHERELLAIKQKELVEQEEKRLLSKFSKKQRDWLTSTIAPALAGGLCYLIEEMPEDPIQMLGCYIGEMLPQDLKSELLFEFQGEVEEDFEEEEDYEEYQ